MTRDVLPMACGICGEDEAFTGSCGGGRNKPTALCYTPLEQPVQPEDHLQAISDFGQLQEQEPAAYMYPADLKRFETSECFADAFSISVGSPTLGTTVPLYTSPPKRQPLTDEEIKKIFLRELGDLAVRIPPGWRKVVSAVEQHHNIGDKT
jgi:hypothetical protein